MAMTKVTKEGIFLMWAITECARAIKAIDEIARLASLRDTSNPGFVVLEGQSVFDEIRLALQCSANVSKVFWPQQSAAARGERLRQLTGLDAKHPLSSRKLRNHIEHIDERLDEWTSPSPRPFLTIELVLHAETNANPNKQMSIDSTAISYDAVSNTVHAFGETFSLTDLRAHVVDVREHISGNITKAL
jgi:hypothetical protein